MYLHQRGGQKGTNREAPERKIVNMTEVENIEQATLEPLRKCLGCTKENTFNNYGHISLLVLC